MTGWTNEIQAGMNPQVDFVDPSGLLLLKHVGFVLIVKKFNNGHPGVPIVYVVSKSRCINDRQADCLQH